MDTRPTHYATRRKSHLTGRQQEVLALIARGRTNFEIAEELGVGYESVKTHVSAILERLDVGSREEAAGWWREQSRWRSRAGNFLHLPAFAGHGHWFAAAFVASVLVLSLAFVGVMLTDGSATPPQSPPEGDTTPTKPATSSPTSTTTSLATAIPTATPQPASPSPAISTPTFAPAGLEPIGLFTNPGTIRDGTVVSVPVQVGAGFERVPGAVIYDTQTGQTFALGEGTQPSFSPDGTKATWIASSGNDSVVRGTARVIFLPGGEIRDFGQASRASWSDNDHLVLQHPLATPGPNKELDYLEQVDVRTGERKVVTPVDGEQSSVQSEAFGLEVIQGPPISYENASIPTTVRRASTGEELLRFTANRVLIADEATVVVATPLVGQVTNIFAVDVRTKQATYVATVIADEWNWPLAATKDWVAWTDSYCDDGNGPTRVFDRTTGSITTYAGEHWWLTRSNSGLLQVGTFGGSTLFDPITRSYVAILPSGQTQWSADDRYAAQGLVGGHGGYCAS